MAELVIRWVRFYTRGLPPSVAERRIGEIEADLHDHIAHERDHGTSDRRIVLSVFFRMGRGVAADLSWRGRHTGAARGAAGILVATALILLVPLLAMQFTDEVAWTVADFVVAGVLLAGTGLSFQALARRAGDTAYRVAVGLALGSALLLVWIVGAVGLIGEEGDRADLMYGGVLGVGIAGALLARFRPGGMARVLLAMAGAQALVAVIALIAGKHQAPISSVWELLGLNGFFVALFAGSAWLFRRAARRQPPAGTDWRDLTPP
jgi:hypothetical protein